MLSNRSEYRNEALNITGHFISKKSGTLFNEIKKFMIDNLGFGDLILRNSSGKKIKSVSSVIDLRSNLEKLPLNSVEYHASRNHFSNWLAIRGEFDLANKFRQIGPGKFQNLKKRKEYHLKLLSEHEKNINDAPIVEFNSNTNVSKHKFTRIGSGSLGGKARGLAFATNQLKNSNIIKKYPNIKIRVPNVTVIGTDEFDRFMNENKLWDIAIKEKSNKRLVKYFLDGKLDKNLIKNLKKLLSNISYHHNVGYWNNFAIGNIRLI